MFLNFTDRSVKAMSRARREAQRLDRAFIGTEHLLLGILLEGGGIAAEVLLNPNVDLKRVRQQIEILQMPSDPSDRGLGELPFSPRVSRVLQMAGEAAAHLGHPVGTEHLLLGLIKETDGLAARVLIALGLNLDEVRDVLLELLAMAPGSGPAQPAPPPTPPESDVFERARTYRALTDRPVLHDSVSRLLQQGRSVALVGPRSVGKTSLILAMSRAKSFDVRSIDYRVFDEFHAPRRTMPARPGGVCFVGEGELVTASRSQVADLLDERRRSGERLILEFRDGGFEDYSKRHPDLARELEVVTVAPPDAAECGQLLEAARAKLQQSSGVRIDDEVLAQTARQAKERWPRMVAPWAAIITLWKAAAIQGESASRGDLHRLEQDIAELESSGKPADAELLRKHVEGLRGVGQTLTLESIRQAISELADKPSAHF